MPTVTVRIGFFGCFTEPFNRLNVVLGNALAVLVLGGRIRNPRGVAAVCDAGLRPGMSQRAVSWEPGAGPGREDSSSSRQHVIVPAAELDPHFRSSAGSALGRRTEPYRGYLDRLQEGGMRAELARLTLARKIAAIAPT